MSPKVKKILGWVFAGLVFAFMAMSGMGKIFATPESEMGVLFKTIGIWDIKVAIGILEILVGLLVLIPRVSTIGMVLAAGYWGGAIATDLTHGNPPYAILIPSVLLLLAALIRNPELFTRLMGKTEN